SIVDLRERSGPMWTASVESPGLRFYLKWSHDPVAQQRVLSELDWFKSSGHIQGSVRFLEGGSKPGYSYVATETVDGEPRGRWEPVTLELASATLGQISEVGVHGR